MRKLTNQNKLSILITVQKMGSMDDVLQVGSLFMGIGKGESYELSE